jgi:hypothetical protein
MWGKDAIGAIIIMTLNVVPLAVMVTSMMVSLMDQTPISISAGMVALLIVQTINVAVLLFSAPRWIGIFRDRHQEKFRTHVQRFLAVIASPSEVHAAVVEYLTKHGAYQVSVASAEFGDIRAVRSELGLFGEVVTVQVTAQADGTALRIDSRCALPTQKIDMTGNNLRNVDEILGWLVERFPVDAELQAREQRLYNAVNRVFERG